MASFKCLISFLILTISLSSCSTYTSFMSPVSSSIAVTQYNSDLKSGMITGPNFIKTSYSSRGLYRLSELRRIIPDIVTIGRDFVLLVLQSVGLLEDNRLYRLHGIAQGVGQLLDDFDITGIKIKHNIYQIIDYIFSFPILRPIKALFYIPIALLKFFINIPSRLIDVIKTYLTYFVFGTY